MLDTDFSQKCENITNDFPSKKYYKWLYFTQREVKIIKNSHTPHTSKLLHCQ